MAWVESFWDPPPPFPSSLEWALKVLIVLTFVAGMVFWNFLSWLHFSCFFFFIFFFQACLEVSLLSEHYQSWNFVFLGLRLRFFDLWVFYSLALGTSLGCCRPTTLKAILIDIASIGAKPESGLGLSVDNFFNYFFEAIKLLAILLHFDLHWSLEILSKILNYCTFLWGTAWVKFN